MFPAAGVWVEAGGLQHPLLAVPQAPAHDHLKVLYSELLSVYHCQARPSTFILHKSSILLCVEVPDVQLHLRVPVPARAV